MERNHASDLDHSGKIFMRKDEGMEVGPCPLPKPGLGVDLWHLYTEEKFWDVTLNVQTKTFHVLKYILCARSPVFMAMFENNSKEKETGIVDIIDVDPDTIEQMLYFMYTDQLNLRSVKNAMLLYSAADKYEVMLLRNECMSYLKSKLSGSNVLDVLSLADLHQDECLKSAAMDYVAPNATEVFKSSQWKTFVLENAPVAVEVMDFVFVQKGMICTPKQRTGLGNSTIQLYREKYGPWQS